MPEIAIYYPEGHTAHAERNHPERPERVETIRNALTQAGWWQPANLLAPIQPAPETLAAIHTPDYLRILESACAQGRHLDADTYTTPATWQLALNAAGGAMAVAAAVWQGHARRGFALCRPPGHHATSGRGMGFCLLNNAALAAEHLRQHLGASKLAIIDFDLHHGNGTQEIFWQRADLLYISTHQRPLYPGSGALHETGAGLGEGATANFPMPPLTGDEGFQTVLHEAIIPLLNRFAPEMLLISYGFDPHWRDPLGNLLLSAAGYGSLIAALTAWADRHCKGRISLILEGGYDLEAAAACGQAVTAALLDQPWQDPLGPAPHREGDSWRAMLREARSLWGL